MPSTATIMQHMGWRWARARWNSTRMTPSICAIERRETAGVGVPVACGAGRGEPCWVIEWESVARETRAIVPVSGGTAPFLEEEAAFGAAPGSSSDDSAAGPHRRGAADGGIVGRRLWLGS